MNIWKTLTALFAIVAVFAILAYFQAGTETKKAQARLESTCTMAFLNLLDTMQQNQLTLEKIQASSAGAMQASLLTQLSRSSAQAQSSLSMLPLSHAAMAPTLTFLNQLSEYAQVLLARSASGGAIEEEAENTLASLLTQCTRLNGQLSLIYRQIYDEGIAFWTDSSVFYEAAADVRPLEQLSDEQAGNSYPSFVYDGAFSDGAGEAKALGLPDFTITGEEAAKAAAAFVGEDRVQNAYVTSETGGALGGWGVTVLLSDVQLYAEVTKQGGRVKYMAPETAAFTPAVSLDSLIPAAQAFLESREFENMELTGYQSYAGMCVLSFVPAQDGVLLYPDQVKVQLRLDTGDVIGFEASAYWQYHTLRAIPSPALSPDEAAARLPNGMKAEQTRLCVIKKNQREIFCYELTARQGDGTYLVYLNAETGMQEDILELANVSGGQMTI